VGVTLILTTFLLIERRAIKFNHLHFEQLIVGRVDTHKGYGRLSCFYLVVIGLAD
jgi:hypothetical protein